MDELKHCPSCDLTEEAFASHKQKMGSTHTVTKDTYMPICYKDRLLNKWVIECQNCGMEVIFSVEEKETIELWNKLPRAEKQNSYLVTKYKSLIKYF